MIFTKSISAKFIAAVFIVFLIGQSIGAFILVLHTSSALTASLQERMKRTAVMTAGVSSGPLLSYDYSLVDAYLMEVAKDVDITSVHIHDAQDKIVRERIKEEDAVDKKLNPFLHKGTMSVRVPVIISGQNLGAVVIDYTAKSVNEKISRSIIVISLIQGIILLVFGILMVILFHRTIKKPLFRIKEGIQKITAGDLTTEIPDPGDNEIGSIAKGVTFLLERLSHVIGKLNSTAANVSMAIKQVDMMHKNVTNSMAKQSKSVQEIMDSIANANKSQSAISTNAEKLASFSVENVTSLLEMKASAEEIASNTQRLYKATEASYVIVLQLSKAAKASSAQSHDIVSAVEDSSASIEEIGTSVKEVEEHAGESAKLAEKVNEITSDTGMLAVVNAVEGMDKISDEFNKSADIIQRLGTRSADIEKVLSVIKDVTEQTNLLSLNAAILAAQAGEYGKSFSVVADEISALSERTASSTREISGIVKTIQKDIKDAVHSIDNAQSKVEEGSKLVFKVGDALKDTLTASEHSSEMTRAIKRATEEQSLALRQITSAIEDIRKMVGSVAGAVHEQEKAMSHLIEGVRDVKDVADISKRGTEEQATGIRVISKNLELANQRIAQISQASLNQKKLNDEIVASMDKINKLGQTAVTDMDDVSHSLNTLAEEIQILKRDVEVFKLS